MRLPDDEEFDRQLLSDAAAQPDAFSPSVHARVMRRVRQEVDAVSSRRLTRRWIEGLSIAAAAIVAVSVTGFIFNRPAATHGRVSVLPAIESLDALADSTRAVDAALHEARYAYLDQDMQSFASFVREVVPSTPMTAKRG